jgi:hypothetical protein
MYEYEKIARFSRNDGAVYFPDRVATEAEAAAALRQRDGLQRTAPDPVKIYQEAQARNVPFIVIWREHGGEA